MSTSIVVNNKAKCQPEKLFYDCRDYLRLSMSDIKLYYFLRCWYFTLQADAVSVLISPASFLQGV